MDRENKLRNMEKYNLLNHSIESVFPLLIEIIIVDFCDICVNTYIVNKIKCDKYFFIIYNS